MHARAEAFADTLGDGRITPEHVLLALLWDAHCHSSQLLWRLGADRQRIVDGLREQGVHDARAFYAGLLGFTEVPKPEHLAARGGCWFTAGEAQVHLGVDPDFRPARKAHPALLVRGLAALVERLRGAGVPAAGGDPGQAYVDDPFGNRVELLERGGTLPGPP